MTGFYPRISGVGVDHSTNCDTAMALLRVEILKIAIPGLFFISFVF